jgi:hypothetical protein
VFYKKLPAQCRELLLEHDIADADDICTGPHHLHRVQKAVELEVVFRSEGRLG